MIASWSAWMVPSTSRIRSDRSRAEARDERGLVVERGAAAQPLRGEHLVPVVADPAAGPPVPAPAHQPHRVRVRRPEERLRRGRPPVEQQPTTRAVRQAEPPDVDRLAVGPDGPPQAQVQAEAPQRPQPRGEPVDLLVPLQRQRAAAPGRLACGVQPLGPARRSTAPGSPRWPRSAARPARSTPGPPWRRGCREGRTHGWSQGSRRHQLRTGVAPPGARPGHGRRFCAADGGLAARPPVGYTLEEAGTVIRCSPFACPRPSGHLALQQPVPVDLRLDVAVEHQQAAARAYQVGYRSWSARGGRRGRTRRAGAHGATW